AGPPVVTLKAPSESGSVKDCADAAADLIKEIRQNPANFYINVHNSEFPDGAVRGQLSK
ncbi:MAG TPA: CHRD domain-containing protein, partial [Blastocatellia bacterium]|nr:CHRD domain-containing protein [Blastocatellia bacterium]